MELIVAVIVFCSLLIGALLRKLTKVEVKPGRPYFILLQKALLVALAIVLVYMNFTNLWVIVAFMLGIFFGAVVHIRWFYLGLGMVGSMLISQNPYFVVACIVFMYGLPYGTRNTKYLKYFILFALPFLLLLFKPIMLQYAPIMAGLAAGALIGRE